MVEFESYEPADAVTGIGIENSLFAQTNSLILENKFPALFRQRVAKSPISSSQNEGEGPCSGAKM